MPGYDEPDGQSLILSPVSLPGKRWLHWNMQFKSLKTKTCIMAKWSQWLDSEPTFTPLSVERNISVYNYTSIPSTMSNNSTLNKPDTTFIHKELHKRWYLTARTILVPFNYWSLHRCVLSQLILVLHTLRFDRRSRTISCLKAFARQLSHRCTHRKTEYKAAAVEKPHFREKFVAHIWIGLPWIMILQVWWYIHQIYI